MEVIDLPKSQGVAEFEARGVISTTYFDSERKFRRALYKCGYIFPFSTDEIIEHERSHVERARSLGYQAQYCLSTNETEFYPDLGLTMEIFEVFL